MNWTGATCRSCGEPVLWARTEAGKRMPVDRDAVLNGNLDLRVPNGQLTAYVVKPDPAAKGFVSHFVTCAQRREWRKKQ